MLLKAEEMREMREMREEMRELWQWHNGATPSPKGERASERALGPEVWGAIVLDTGYRMPDPGSRTPFDKAVILKKKKKRLKFRKPRTLTINFELIQWME
jgi:hypothetical protein